MQGKLKMADKRESTDRRTEKDRRSGGRSNYNGPERRSERFRRSGVDRRNRSQARRVRTQPLTRFTGKKG